MSGFCVACGNWVEDIRAIWGLRYCVKHYERRMEELTNADR